MLSFRRQCPPGGIKVQRVTKVAVPVPRKTHAVAKSYSVTRATRYCMCNYAISVHCTVIQGTTFGIAVGGVFAC